MVLNKDEYNFIVKDKTTDTIITSTFVGFCKCGLMATPGEMIYIKDAEKDFEFIIEKK